MLVCGNLNDLDWLPTDEALLRFQQESIEPEHEKYRLSDHDDLKNLHMRGGTFMHSSEFIRKILQLNPLIFVEQQINYSDNWGLYFPVRGRKKYISCVPKGWLREFSAILVDERNLMDGDEIRGWRTILVRLLGMGLLQWPQARRVFGDAGGINSQRWQRYTQIFRNGCEQRILENLE